MNTRWLTRLPLLAAAVLAPGLGACESSWSPTEVDLAPQHTWSAPEGSARSDGGDEAAGPGAARFSRYAVGSGRAAGEE